MELCSLAAASEEYADFIVEHNNYSRELLEELTGTDCIDLISRQYAAVYVPADQALPLSLTKYSYTSIPKLYTLLDTSALEASGISAVLAQPALSTGGEDVMIGFVDTGISYCSPLFWTGAAAPEFWASGIRPFPRRGTGAFSPISLHFPVSPTPAFSTAGSSRKKRSTLP